MVSVNGTEEQTTEVTIPQSEWKLLTVTIEGTKPLLMNRFGQKAMDAMEAVQAKTAESSQAKAARKPKEEIEDKLWKSASGHPCLTESQVKKMLINTGIRHTELTGTHIVGQVFPEGEEGLFPILPGEYTMDRTWGRLASGVSSLIYRPRFWPWSSVISIRYDSVSLSTGQVLDLVIKSGERMGIGSFRLENKGPYGAFKVVKAEEEPWRI